MFGVVDETTTTKFASRACAVHCPSLPVVVDKVVVVVLKFPNRSQMTSKCGIKDQKFLKNKKVAHEAQPVSVSLMFLPHFDVLCDLLGNLRTTTTTLSTTTGSEIQCTAQARLANFVVVVSSTTPNTVQSRRPASQAMAGINPLFLGYF